MGFFDVEIPKTETIEIVTIDGVKFLKTTFDDGPSRLQLIQSSGDMSKEEWATHESGIARMMMEIVGGNNDGATVIAGKNFGIMRNGAGSGIGVYSETTPGKLKKEKEL